jgi:hypothetical protein
MSAPPPYGNTGPGSAPPPGAVPPGGYPANNQPSGGYYYPAAQGYNPAGQGYGAARPARSNRGCWIAAIVVGALLVCCVGGFGVSALLGAGLFTRTVTGITESQAAATDFFAAVATHDWTTAHGALSVALRASTTPTILQATWTARERQHGRVTHFDPSGANISTQNGKTTAQVTGMLYYDSGYSEHQAVNLVKEQGVWKLATLP